MPELKPFMDLHLDLMSHFKSTRFLGINLLTKALPEEEALESIHSLETAFQLPVTDLLRFGNRGLISNIYRTIKGGN